VSCHQDTHQGQFARAPHANRCEDCHSVKGFRPSRFTLANHDAARFALAGAHAAIPCASCHKAAPPEPARYRFSDLSCAGCHEDPHRGQFRQRMLAARTGNSPRNCEACHTVRSWRDLSRFDHATTAFALTGVHRVVRCEECHRRVDGSSDVRSVSFAAAPKICGRCHEDVHAGQFSARTGSTDCGRCHLPAQWKSARFDHDADASFKLTGAHKGVPCRLCHTATRVVGGKIIVTYKATPKECAGCHGPRLAALKKERNRGER
jgi:hypothetical protein